LWWNDPDAIVLTGDLSEDEFRFHATSIFASGGMLLSGDDLTKINSDRLAMLRKLQPPIGKAASFDDDSFRVGRIRHGTQEIVCVLNFGDTPQTVSFKLSRPVRITDYWSGGSMGLQQGVFTIKDMPRRSARLLVCS
jgi:alpha-galactosidase